MTSGSQTHNCCRRPAPTVGRVSGTVLSLLLLMTPIAVFAHAGHGDEFQGGNHAVQSVDAIQIDPVTADHMGLKVESVSRRSLAFGIEATGQIELLPRSQVKVTNPVGGTVIKLLVEPGQAVKAGQPLAVITSGELAELRVIAQENQAERQGEVQQAQADLRLAQQSYAQQQQIALTAIEQAQTELRVAQEQYDRDRQLMDQGAVARREFLESEAHLAEAKKVLAEANSQLEVLAARNQLERAQTAVKVAQSRTQLSAATYKTRLQQLGTNANSDGTITIKAPIAGVIADREITLGQSAEDAGATLMTIVDDRTVLATANIYEKDLNQISQGQRVRITVASLPQRGFEGRITTIGSGVEAESRVVPVKVELANADGFLKPGMFAELEVLTQQTPEPVLVIPQSAIVEADGHQLVFVQNGNTFQPVEVGLGRRAGDLVEVKTGLFDGDRIVTQRANLLYAQSLRSGTEKPEDAKVAEPVAVKKATVTAGILPWWVILPGTGFLAIGTFAAGVFWSNHRNRRTSHTPQTSHIPQPRTAAATALEYLGESHKASQKNLHNGHHALSESGHEPTLLQTTEALQQGSEAQRPPQQ